MGSLQSRRPLVCAGANVGVLTQLCRWPKERPQPYLHCRLAAPIPSQVLAAVGLRRAMVCILPHIAQRLFTQRPQRCWMALATSALSTAGYAAALSSTMTPSCRSHFRQSVEKNHASLLL